MKLRLLLFIFFLINVQATTLLIPQVTRTPNSVLAKIKQTKQTIKNVLNRYSLAKNSAIVAIKKNYLIKYNRVKNMKKGMFETHAEFALRKKIMVNNLRKNEASKIASIIAKYTTLKRESTNTLNRKLEKLLKQTIFTIPQQKLKFKFNAFDSNLKAFPITISCNTKYFQYWKQLYYKIDISNAGMRRQKGMIIWRKVKANAYIAILKYKLNVETGRCKFWSVAVKERKKKILLGLGTHSIGKDSSYTGKIIDGKQEGYGTYRCKYYSYIGNWKNGKEHGYGTRIWNDKEKTKYSGYWKNGSKDGKGRYTSKTYQYSGSWKNDNYHGYGTFIFDSHRYVGNFKNGKRNGIGTSTWKDGTKYTGQWKNDKKHGTGTYICNQFSYKGNWQNDEQHGNGVMTWKNGDKYMGNFKNGFRNGQGTYTWKNGTKYKGEWKKNKIHGYGTMTWSSGTSWSGTWVNGRPKK